MNQIPIATILLIGVTGVLTYRGATRPSFMEKYVFSSQAVLGGREYVRLVSSGFLHANWLHFGFNVFTIYSFGSGIETLYGARVLLVVFFASVLGGNALSLYLHRNHDYLALGASGGACGILFAHMFLLPGGSVSPVFVPIHIPAWLYAIMFLVGSVLRTPRPGRRHRPRRPPGRGTDRLGRHHRNVPPLGPRPAALVWLPWW